MNSNIFYKEFEIASLYLEDANASLELMYITEDVSKIGMFFDAIIEKIKKLIKVVKDKLRSIFSKPNNNLKKVEEEASKNPKIKQIKCERFKNYEKTEKINEEAMNELKNAKTGTDIERIMNTRSRKIAAVGVISVLTIGAALVYLKTRKSKSSKNIDNIEKKSEEVVKTAKDTAQKASNNPNEKNKEKIIATQQAKVNAASEIVNDSGKNAVEEPDVVASIILKAFYNVFNGTEHEDIANKYANRTIKQINANTSGKWKVQTAIDYVDYYARTTPVNYSWDPVNKKPITLNNPKNEYYDLRRKALEIAHKDLNKEKDRVSKNVHL